MKTKKNRGMRKNTYKLVKRMRRKEEELRQRRK
jgi:hypothetical protein